MEVLDLSGGVKVEPLVSIITPSYNSEKFLDAFFISILEQDYKKYEVIFINDEFNHFEGNMNIFQPAIDITEAALQKEVADIESKLMQLRAEMR